MKGELLGALRVPAACGELGKEQCRAGQEQQLCEEHKWQGKLSELSETEPRTCCSLVPFSQSLQSVFKALSWECGFFSSIAANNCTSKFTYL